MTRFIQSKSLAPLPDGKHLCNSCRHIRTEGIKTKRGAQKFVFAQHCGNPAARALGESEITTRVTACAGYKRSVSVLIFGNGV